MSSLDGYVLDVGPMLVAAVSFVSLSLPHKRGETDGVNVQEIEVGSVCQGCFPRWQFPCNLMLHAYIDNPKKYVFVYACYVRNYVDGLE